jgi:hypothetical protein
MNKEYVLEKLAEGVGDYIGNGPHPVATTRGVLDAQRKKSSNLKLLRESHIKHMNKTGLPITLGEFRRLIDSGEVSNPLEPGFFKRHGKTSLLLGAGALAGLVGAGMLGNEADKTPVADPQLTQVYNAPGGQMPYGQ